eukprot:ANDGO_03384.mRNA.1 Protein MON2 homolog
MSLLANLEQDLRALSIEAGKKRIAVKESAEKAIVRVRNIRDSLPSPNSSSSSSSNSGAGSWTPSTPSGYSDESDFVAKQLLKSDEILQPLFLACRSDSSKLVLLALPTLQKCLQYRVFLPSSSPELVDCFASLISSSFDDTVYLKMLQTLVAFLTSKAFAVPPDSFSTAISTCFKLVEAKSPVVSSTAGATMKQFATLVFDPRERDDERLNSHQFLRDVTRATSSSSNQLLKLLGLELIDIVLANHYSVLIQTDSILRLVKEEVCTLVFRYLPTNEKLQIDYPLFLRLLRLLFRLLLNFSKALPAETTRGAEMLMSIMEEGFLTYQRCLALDILRRLADSVAWVRDMHATNVPLFEALFQTLQRNAQASLDNEMTSRMNSNMLSVASKFAGIDASNDSELPVVGQPELLRLTVDTLSNISKSFAIMCDILRGGRDTERIPVDEQKKKESISDGLEKRLSFASENGVAADEEGPVTDVQIVSNMIAISWRPLMGTLSLILARAYDELVLQRILPIYQTFIHVCGICKLDEVRDVFLVDLCRFSQPLSTSMFPNAGSGPLSGSPEEMAALHALDGNTNGNSSSAGALSADSYKMHPKNVQVLKALFNIAHCIGGLLGTSWKILLRNFQLLDKLLFPDNPQSAGTKAVSETTSDDLRILTDALQNLFQSSSNLSLHSITDLLQALQRLSEETLVLLAPTASSTSVLSPSAGSTSSSTTVSKPRLFAIRGLFSSLHNNLARIPELWNVVADHLAVLCKFPETFVRSTAIELTTDLICAILDQNNCTLDMETRLVSFYTGLFAAHDAPDLRVSLLRGLHSIVRDVGSRMSKPETWSSIMHALARAALYMDAGLFTGSSPAPPSAASSSPMNGGGLTSSSSSSLTPGSSPVLGSSGDSSTALAEDPGFAISTALTRAGFQVSGTRLQEILQIAFESLSLIGNDYLPHLEHDLVHLYIDMLGVFSIQSVDTNISLAAMTSLWSTADFLSSPSLRSQNSEPLWILLFSKLRECVRDVRPSARNGALKTLLSSMPTHAAKLSVVGLMRCLSDTLVRLLSIVESESGRATDEENPPTAGPQDPRTSQVSKEQGMKMLVHHSRNTVAKQWEETRSLAISGVVRAVLAISQIILVKKVGELQDPKICQEIVALCASYGIETSSDCACVVRTFHARCVAEIFTYIQHNMLSTSNEVCTTTIKAFDDLITAQCFSVEDLAWDTWTIVMHSISQTVYEFFVEGRKDMDHIPAGEDKGCFSIAVMLMMHDSWMKVPREGHESQLLDLLEDGLRICLCMEPSKKSAPADSKTKKFFEYENRLVELLKTMTPLAGSLDNSLSARLLSLFKSVFENPHTPFLVAVLELFHETFAALPQHQDAYLDAVGVLVSREHPIYENTLRRWNSFLSGNTFRSSPGVSAFAVRVLRAFDGRYEPTLEIEMIRILMSKRDVLFKVFSSDLLSTVASLTSDGGARQSLGLLNYVPVRPWVLREAAYNFLIFLLGVDELRELADGVLREKVVAAFEECSENFRRLRGCPLSKPQRLEMNLILDVISKLPSQKAVLRSLHVFSGSLGSDFDGRIRQLLEQLL